MSCQTHDSQGSNKRYGLASVPSDSGTLPDVTEHPHPYWPIYYCHKGRSLQDPDRPYTVLHVPAFPLHRRPLEAAPQMSLVQVRYSPMGVPGEITMQTHQSSAVVRGSIHAGYG
jgi:hypothetical protein